MLSQVLGMLKTALEACFGWFNDVIEATGTYTLIIGVFTMLIVFRTLIIPLIGFSFGGASDMASKETYRVAREAQSSERTKRINSGKK